MKHQYTAIIERERGWYTAHCIEIPGANGQGPTEEDAQKSLAEAITLVLLDRIGETGEQGEGDESVVVH